MFGKIFRKPSDPYDIAWWQVPEMCGRQLLFATAVGVMENKFVIVYGFVLILISVALSVAIGRMFG